eukprot:136367_1
MDAPLFLVFFLLLTIGVLFFALFCFMSAFTISCLVAFEETFIFFFLHNLMSFDLCSLINRCFNAISSSFQTNSVMVQLRKKETKTFVRKYRIAIKRDKPASIASTHNLYSTYIVICYTPSLIIPRLNQYI